MCSQNLKDFTQLPQDSLVMPIIVKKVAYTPSDMIGRVELFAAVNSYRELAAGPQP